MQRIKELRFSQTRHVLAPRVEVGIWRDLQLHLELPIVVADDRSLNFAQNGGAPCGDPRTTSCVTSENSSLVRDGLLDGGQMTPNQVAVANASGPPGGRVLPTRSGVDQLYLGIAWAAVNQRRDPSKPTWVNGFEARLAVGSPMEYDATTDPRRNTSVGRGLHELRFHTSVSRRFRWVEPWFSAHYLLPIAAKDSLFAKTEFPRSGQQRAQPQHSAGGEVGAAFVAWERPAQHYAVTIEASTALQATFEGRGYSPMWEVFANSPQLGRACHPAPGGADQLTPWDNGNYCAAAGDTLPYPGITSIENHLSVTGTLGVRAQLTRWAHLRLGLALGHEQGHYITFASVGRGSDPNQEIQISDPFQVNPSFQPLVDTVGRRFRISDVTTFDFSLGAVAMF
ncbi:MAG: hypothetical protein IPL40_03400 [Proteobacteria bacterium]|nr:hypothetical protein [Pseudomonadota bacterium]